MFALCGAESGTHAQLFCLLPVRLNMSSFRTGGWCGHRGKWNDDEEVGVDRGQAQLVLGVSRPQYDEHRNYFYQCCELGGSRHGKR